VPAVEALLPRFRAAHTQVLGVSVDSIFCHANWGQSLNGVSFPLLADFHPKGAMAKSYGLYLDQAGITDRATVIIDAGGVVRHASSVTPSGQRNIEELAALCEEIDREHGSGLADFPAPAGIGKTETLFVKSSCGFSQKVMLVRENLHLEDRIQLKNVTDDAKAKEELVRVSGKDQAPCLIVDGKPMQDSDEIVRYLVGGATDVG
jgi:hypothetical protein